MLKLNAASFYRATAAVYNMQSAIGDWKYKKGESAINVDSALDEVIAEIIRGSTKELQSSLLILGTKVTAMAVDRLLKALALEPPTITYSQLSKRLTEIDSRLKDELSLVATFVLEADKVKFFEPTEPLFGIDFETKFASGGIYEVDEAAKCIALGCDTAAVFHLMRCMEIGIRAVAKSLGIPDPIRGSDRNWHEMLKKIKGAMEAKLNPPTWKSGDREIFESAYVSLDAVRAAWRNTTMHVENKYTAEEAEHIFIAVRGFMKNLASRIDEQGLPLA